MDDLLPGDVAKKHDTGGLFTVEAVAEERPRVTNWEISATGPIYGYKMMEAKDEAADLEAQILEEVGMRLEDFRSVKAKGSRRALRYRPADLDWHVEGDVLTVTFSAPKGAYATLFLRELMKSEAAEDAD
jgi:tRNA pseudouridine13 synthase